MAKASISTGEQAQPVHTRTTAGSEESQAVVLAIDGSDSVIPADDTFGLSVDLKRSATVPISAASLPLPSDAASQTTLGVISSNLGVPTDGSATNNGSLIGIVKRIRDLLSGTLTISGAVTGPLTDTQLRATAVPVAGPLTDTQLRSSAVPVSLATAPTTPVTGTFWQATQPVSGPLTDTQLRATAVPVSGTVSAAQSGTWTFQRTTDGGLQPVQIAWDEVAGTANVESALTNATFRTENMVSLSAASSYTVPAGKRFRITNISNYVKATSTVNNLARFRLRAVASGSVANSSPVVWNNTLSLDAPGTVAANLMAERSHTFPEGSLDFPAGAQLTFTWLTAANTCTVGLSATGYLYTP